VLKALGIHWVYLAMLALVPRSQRTWPLPFMAVLALGQKISAKLNKRHWAVFQFAQSSLFFFKDA
jgi:hypothetical protein